MNKRFKHSTSRIYLYKMTTDNGGAPAVYRGRLSLAICKPRIRGKAEVGDWLIGVAGKGLRQGAPLIYIARVSEVLENGSYYADPRFAKRPDSIYRWNGSKLSIKPRAPFHDPMDAFRDIGSGPTHAGARVLLCDRYRYFGRGASDWYAAVARSRTSSEPLKRRV